MRTSASIGRVTYSLTAPTHWAASFVPVFRDTKETDFRAQVMIFIILSKRGFHKSAF